MDEEHHGPQAGAEDAGKGEDKYDHDNVTYGYYGNNLIFDREFDEHLYEFICRAYPNDVNDYYGNSLIFDREFDEHFYEFIYFGLSGGEATVVEAKAAQDEGHEEQGAIRIGVVSLFWLPRPSSQR